MQAYVAGHGCLDEDVPTNRLLTFGPAARPGRPAGLRQHRRLPDGPAGERIPIATPCHAE
ncbi:hypothetical protein ACTMU2_11720 [Cupriavidus basilensis]